MERNERIVIDAIFTQYPSTTGEGRAVVRKDGKWTDVPVKNIANLNTFSGGNPLSALLSGNTQNAKYERTLPNQAVSEMPQFDFGEDDRKVFIINANSLAPYAIPLNMEEQDLKVQPEQKDYTLQDLYDLGEKIAIEE